MFITSWLNIRRLSCVWVLCQVDLAFSLCSHKSLNFTGYVVGWSLGVPGWSGFLSGMLYADEVS